MGETQGPTKKLQLPVDSRVRLLVLPARGDVGLDRPGDVHRAPVPEVVSQGLEVGQDGGEGLDPTHPVVRHEIVQERAELELPVLGSRELLEPLAVSGELVELLPVEPLGELQVRGAGGDLVLLAPNADD